MVQRFKSRLAWIYFRFTHSDERIGESHSLGIDDCEWGRMDGNNKINIAQKAVASRLVFSVVKGEDCQLYFSLCPPDWIDSTFERLIKASRNLWLLGSLWVNKVYNFIVA